MAAMVANGRHIKSLWSEICMSVTPKNDQPVCVSCTTPATCMRQTIADPFDWEWHCDSCCTHGMQPEVEDGIISGVEADLVCIQAIDVPMYYGTLDNAIGLVIRERDEALRILRRLTSEDMAEVVFERVRARLMSETCGGCDGAGQILTREWWWPTRIFRTCRRCNGDGAIIVKQQ